MILNTHFVMYSISVPHLTHLAHQLSNMCQLSRHDTTSLSQLRSSQLPLTLLPVPPPHPSGPRADQASTDLGRQLNCCLLW